MQLDISDNIISTYGYAYEFIIRMMKSCLLILMIFSSHTISFLNIVFSTFLNIFKSFISICFIGKNNEKSCLYFKGKIFGEVV